MLNATERHKIFQALNQENVAHKGIKYAVDFACACNHDIVFDKNGKMRHDTGGLYEYIKAIYLALEEVR